VDIYEGGDGTHKYKEWAGLQEGEAFVECNRQGALQSPGWKDREIPCT
jgi:hypothetical protein